MQYVRVLFCCVTFPALQIRFVQDNELSKVLAEEIPPHLLPKMYGGEAELKGLWDEYVESTK